MSGDGDEELTSEAVARLVDYILETRFDTTSGPLTLQRLEFVYRDAESG
jgi:hypothetical protein